MDKPLDPQKVVCIIKKNGKEIGRIAATAKNAPAYIDNLARHHGGCEVEYVEDEQEAETLRLFD